MATRPIRASQFGAEAPPKNLILPQGNVTLYEQLVFLPNSIRNLDVVLRFAYNGVHQETVSNIIENGRILHKNTGCSVNTALKIMQHGPRYRFSHKTGSGDNWTPAKAFEEDRPDNWDKTNISWNGCRVDAVQKPGCGSAVDGVPFEDLAKGVKKMPTGFDALDLTRCVEVAQKNPGVYEFPRDFPTILQQLGGPAAVRYGHLDAAVARRHTRKSVVFKRHLAAGLITEPDNKLVVQAVPDTTTIGNGSFGSSAADKASSNDGVGKTKLLSTGIRPKIPGVGHAVQSPPSEIRASLIPTSPSRPRRATGIPRPTFPGRSTLAGVSKNSDSRLKEAVLLSTGIGLKISGVGRAVQVPADEMQEVLVPISPTTPRRMTSDLPSTIPDNSTQRRKRHPSGPVPNRTASPTLPVKPSLKRRRGDNDILSADDWAKRLKRDYYQDSDYDIVDSEYLLFKDYAAGVSSRLKSTSEARSQSQSYPAPGVGEDPPNSAAAPAPTTFESDDAFQLQDETPEDDFLASVSSLW